MTVRNDLHMYEYQNPFIEVELGLSCQFVSSCVAYSRQDRPTLEVHKSNVGKGVWQGRGRAGSKDRRMVAICFERVCITTARAELTTKITSSWL